MAVAALPLLGLLLSLPAAAAPSIPWAKLKGAGDLLSSERETAAAVLAAHEGYHRCKASLARCLSSKPRDPVAWGLAEYVVFLAGKGLENKDIDKALALRRKSALPTKTHRLPTKGAPLLGPASAPVVIVEYADLRCGHCATLAPLLKRIVGRAKGQVALYFKPYPLAPGASVVAARAALAAHRQGKFWALQQPLFDNPDQHTEAGVRKLAAKAGLDGARFARDLADKGLLKLIDLIKIEGLRLGLKGTPTIYVNGKLYQLRKDERHLGDRIREELQMLGKGS